MEPEARYAVVGTTVLVLLAALVAAVLWLVASGEHRDNRSYRIYFARQSLEGLQVRSEVRMKGIRVGDVSAFAFAANRPGTVEVEVSLEPSTPVRQSTLAVVERNLVTGLATLRLLNPTEDSPLMTQAPPGEPLPVIAEGSSQLQQVSESLNLLVVRADETLRRINTTLSDENQVAIAQTLTGLRDLTQQANGVMRRLDGTLAAAGRSAEDLRLVGKSFGADVHQLATRYDALGTEATTSIHDVSISLRQLSGDLSALSNRADGAIADSEMQLRTATREVGSAAQALTQVAHRLGDPRSALFGPAPSGLGPGEQPR